MKETRLPPMDCPVCGHAGCDQYITVGSAYDLAAVTCSQWYARDLGRANCVREEFVWDLR
jgi:hypothetical protein